MGPRQRRTATLIASALAGVAPVSSAPAWRTGAPPPRHITARSDHAMVYDSGRGRLVLHGGDRTAGPGGDTWEYGLLGWSRVETPGTPGFCTGHAMAYDSARGRVVLFGCGGTWEYDGLDWYRFPAAGPLPRRDSAMAYDRVRRAVVLFGGDNAPTFYADTWFYDGTSWTAGPTAPSGMRARSGHGAVHDVRRNRTVVFGGWIGGGAYATDTWELDGAGWVQGPSPPAAFPPRGNFGMAYDEGSGKTVLFGGGTASIAYQDTWLYDGAAWSQGPIVPAIGRLIRVAMTYDAERKRVVLFGGDRGGSGYNPVEGTWQFDGAAWSALPRGSGLIGRIGHGMTYDADRERVVLFGGYEREDATSSVERNDTWEFDGLIWTEAPAPTRPPARRYHGMAYDSGRRRTVVFGGSNRNDTWEYDGSSWVRGPAAPAGLVGRSDGPLAYHPGLGRTVLFGGRESASALGDTWEYDGAAWVPGAAPAPTPRWGHRLAYDPSRGAVVMFGAEDETWEYGPSGWTQLAPPTSPGRRLWPAMAFDSSRGSIVIDGGANGTSDTWEFFGGTWTPGPPGDDLFLEGMADLPATGGLVQFGGQDFNSGYDQVTLYQCATVAPATLPWGRRGAPYAATLSASGGTPPYTFTLPVGALPPGLTLDPAGAISGAPTSGGHFTFLARADDGAGCAGSAVLQISVAGPVDVVAGRGLGPGNANTVAVLAGDGTPTAVVFDAYAAGAWGARVAGGDIDGGTTDEMVTGPGPGPTFGPRVRTFRRDGTPIAKVDYFAYGTLRYGVVPSSGELDADGFHELCTGPGPGTVFGPQVRGFDFDGAQLAAMPRVNFYAYGTLAFGVLVASGDVDRDGFGEILTGPGPGPSFAPTVRGFDYDGALVTPISKIAFWAMTPAGYGILVAAGDVDGDGYAEMATGPGPGPTGWHRSRLRGFGYDAASVSALPGFDVTHGSALQGAAVAVGDLHPDGRAEALAASGPDPAASASISAYEYSGGALVRRLTVTPFASAYGATVAAAALDW